MTVKMLTIFILTAGLVTSILLIALWLFAINHFNPITNKDEIETMYSIVDKLEQHEATTPLSAEELRQSYYYVDYSQEEELLFEPRGVVISRFNGRYKVTIPHGFDNRVYYIQSADCWYGSWEPVGLPVCTGTLHGEE